MGRERNISKVKSHNSTQKKELKSTKDDDDDRCSPLLLPLSTTAAEGDGSLGSGVVASEDGSGQHSGVRLLRQEILVDRGQN